MKEIIDENNSQNENPNIKSCEGIKTNWEEENRLVGEKIHSDMEQENKEIPYEETLHVHSEMEEIPEKKELLPVKSREYLKVEFTHDEIHEKGIQLGRMNLEYSSLDNDKKSAMSQFKSKMDAKQNEINLLSNQINQGYEYNNVDCITHYHNPSYGKKTLIRTDTNEIVRVESMNSNELQMEIPFKEE